MPTYQYRCNACREPLEVLQSFTDAPRTECPTCGGALRKVFSAVGVVFKGSGFYQNDSRPAPKSESPGTGAGKEGDAGKPAAAKTDGGPQSDRPAKSADRAEKSAEKPKADKPAKKQPPGSDTHKVA